MNLQKHGREIGRHLRNFNFEMTPGGILIDRKGMNALANGAFKTFMVDDGGGQYDAALDPNLVVDQALIDMLNVYFNGAVATTQWHVALFGGNVTPQPNWTGASWVAAATEFTAYSETTRPIFDTDPATTPEVGNAGNEALFTFVGSGLTVRGAAIVSASAKSATSGILYAATRFANDRVGLGAPDKLGVEYVVTAADAGT